MRYLVIIVFLALFMAPAKGQVPDNAGWCPPGATWTYEHVSMTSNNYWVFKYIGDTVIQGLTSKTMTVHSINIGYLGPNGQGYYATSNYMGSEYYRQSGDSIFWWTGNAFQLIVRLNAQVSDKWVIANPHDVCQIYPQYPHQDTVKVLNTKKDTINGRIYDEVKAKSDSGYFLLGYQGRVMSGIGSLETPYPFMNIEKCYALAGSSVTDAGRFFALVCYSDSIRGQVFALSSPNQNCGYIVGLTTGVSNLVAKQGIIIRSWPNPVGNELLLEGVPARATYTVVTIDGKPLRAGVLRNGTFSTEGLLPGIYLLQVVSRDMTTVLKVVKR